MKIMLDMPLSGIQKVLFKENTKVKHKRIQKIISKLGLIARGVGNRYKCTGSIEI